MRRFDPVPAQGRWGWIASLGARAGAVRRLRSNEENLNFAQETDSPPRRIAAIMVPMKRNRGCTQAKFSRLTCSWAAFAVAATIVVLLHTGGIARAQSPAVAGTEQGE